MSTYKNLQHTRWECKYHVVFIPKYRRKALYGGLRKHLGEVFRRLAHQKECEIEEGHLMPDHVHMMISIPPKRAVSQVVGYIKRQERDPHRTQLWRAAPKLCGRALLGAGVLRVHSRP